VRRGRRTVEKADVEVAEEDDGLGGEAECHLDLGDAHLEDRLALGVLDLEARLDEVVAGELAQALGPTEEERRRVGLGEEEGLTRRQRQLRAQLRPERNRRTKTMSPKPDIQSSS